MNIVLIGAGSAQFGVGTLNDIYQSKVLAGSTITLLDINQHALEVVFQAAEAYRKEHNLAYTLKATTNRKEALQGADAIIISIEVGDRFALWDQDWKIPMQYGIRQVYGENGGAGGTFHALRIIPPILEICKDVATICPDAHIFNYSNPMTAICTTVKRVYPNLKFVGLCHEIASLERYLPAILDTPFENLELEAAGLNHFSMLLTAQYKGADSTDSANSTSSAGSDSAGSTNSTSSAGSGKAGSIQPGTDAYPDILAKAPPFFEKEPGFTDMLLYNKQHQYDHVEGSIARFGEVVKESKIPWADRTLFKELLETYKLMPITTDSHMGEYISWAWDSSDHRGIEDFYQLYREGLSKLEPKFGEPIHERIVPILEGIAENAGFTEAAVNVLNREPGAPESTKAIADLPDWIAVEVPATVTAEGLTAKQVTIPKGFCALLRNYTGAYDLIAEAIIHKDKELVRQSLLANPVVHSSKGLDKLINQMIDLQSPWLDYLA